MGVPVCRKPASDDEALADAIEPVPLQHLPEEDDLQLTGEPPGIIARCNCGPDQRVAQQGGDVFGLGIGAHSGSHELEEDALRMHRQRFTGAVIDVDVPAGQLGRYALGQVAVGRDQRAAAILLERLAHGERDHQRLFSHLRRLEPGDAFACLLQHIGLA